MTTIIVTQEDNDVTEFDFDPGQQVISIGRRANNDVCISDLSVSGKHARITVEGDTIWLEDLNSTNGTYVNGQAVKRRKIVDSDDIVIGKVRLICQSDLPVTAAAKNERTESALTRPVAASAEQPVSDFGDGHCESMDELDPLVMNEASHGIDSDRGSSAHVGDTRVIDSQVARSAPAGSPSATAHPLDGVERAPAARSNGLATPEPQTPMHELDTTPAMSKGAVIEIKNGAKSGQILPIDKPVTTLGRPGIQIAAIMRKPDGYFLMHIESDDSVERPTLNRDTIGDEPVLLHSGDELNVAGIDVEFMLS